MQKKYLIFLLILSFLTISCAKKDEIISYKINNWEIIINRTDNSINLKHYRLKKMFELLSFENNIEQPFIFKDIIREDTRIVFIEDSKKISLDCRSDRIIIKSIGFKGLLTGKFFANENKILARTKEQNNNIIFASLGYISSNITNKLFDKTTDTLIIFPKKSVMKRDNKNKDYLNIRIALKEDSEIKLIKNYYKKLGLKYYYPKRGFFKTAPVGWSSWYSYFMKADETALIKESDAVSKYFKDFGMKYIQLDACYTRGEEANYINWDKKGFPRGGKWIFQYIKSKGLKPALWINLYGSNYRKPEMERKYPDNFYLRDNKGKLSGACCTADKTVKRLDYSNPTVLEKHLIPMLKLLKEDWGLSYLKDAGWGTWMDYYENNRGNSFNPKKTSREIYLEVQKAARKTLGDDVYILGCAMHEVGLGFGIYDGSRIGDDDKAVWYPEKKNGFSMQIFFHSLFGGAFLNNIVWHSDPDAVMVREPLNYEEGKTIVSSIGLLGQLYMASDFMGKLPPEKMELYRKTIPTTYITPMDLYPFNVKDNIKEGALQCCPRLDKFPKALDLKVGFLTGDYDVLALYNWKDEESENSIDLSEELGLSAKNEYILFNFWEEKLEKGYKNRFNTLFKSKIPPHGVKVIIIRRKKGIPQLLTSSRHITGTVSIKKFNKWDKNTGVISGSSEIINNYNYKLYFYIPDNYKYKKIEANSMIYGIKQINNLLIANFKNLKKGEKSLNWKIYFKKP
jgi:hypothetical protein